MYPEAPPTEYVALLGVPIPLELHVVMVGLFMGRWFSEGLLLP